MRKSLILLTVVFLLTACSSVRFVQLEHIPSEVVSAPSSGNKTNRAKGLLRFLLVDRGDWRGTKGENEDYLGTGFYTFSETTFYATDQNEKPASLNQFILSCLAKDLRSIGHEADLLKDRYTPIKTILDKNSVEYDYLIGGRLIQADSYHRSYATLIPFFHYFEGHFRYYLEIYHKGLDTPLLQKEYDTSVEKTKFVKLLVFLGTPLDSLMGHVAASDINDRIREALDIILVDIEKLTSTQTSKR